MKRVYFLVSLFLLLCIILSFIIYKQPSKRTIQFESYRATETCVPKPAKDYGILLAIYPQIKFYKPKPKKYIIVSSNEQIKPKRHFFIFKLIHKKRIDYKGLFIRDRLFHCASILSCLNEYMIQTKDYVCWRSK